METHLQKFLACVKEERAAAKRLDLQRYGSPGWEMAQKAHKACQDRVDFLVAGWPEAELEAPASSGELGDYNSEDAWMQTRTGLAVYPLQPDIHVISIVDCAYSLARINRYNGHARAQISVGYHSLLVSYNVPEEHALAALFHDAPEYILGDIIRPLKRTPLFAPYSKIEDKWLALFGQKYGFDTPLDPCIKLADNGALKYEQEHFMEPPPKPWKEYEYTEITKFPNVRSFEPNEVEDAFIHRFIELKGF